MAGEASSFKLDSELVWRRMGKRRDQLEDASGRIVARVRRGYWRSAFISDPCAPRPIRVATDTREYKTVRRMGVHHLVDTAGDPWVTHTTPGFRRGPIAAGADRDFRYSVSGMLSDPLAASMVIVDDRDRSVLKLRWRTVEPRPVFASFKRVVRPLARRISAQNASLCLRAAASRSLGAHCCRQPQGEAAASQGMRGRICRTLARRQQSLMGNLYVWRTRWASSSGSISRRSSTSCWTPSSPATASGVVTCTGTVQTVRCEPVPLRD